FQALAVRRAGAVFSDEELVLTTASHAGTAAHQAIALHMLESFDHVEADLGCPPDLPFDRWWPRWTVVLEGEARGASVRSGCPRRARA
ncbi:asparaginase, partial [Bacillus sp. S34]|nr:asparaginase [Bacillus sp. S34]